MGPSGFSNRYIVNANLKFLLNIPELTKWIRIEKKLVFEYQQIMGLVTLTKREIHIHFKSCLLISYCCLT